MKKMIQNKKMYIIIGVVIALLSLIFYFAVYVPSKMQVEEKETGIVELEETDESVSTKEDIAKAEQEEKEEKENIKSQIPKIQVNRLKGIIVEKKNYGSEIVYKTIIGVGDSTKEVDIIADADTVFFDIESEQNISPNMLVQNTKFNFLGSGKIATDDLRAKVLTIGDSKDFKYSIIQEVKKVEEEYHIQLATGNEILKIEKNENLRNGMTGKTLVGIEILTPGSGILFTVKPDFKQTEEGLLYDFEKLWLVNRK